MKDPRADLIAKLTEYVEEQFPGRGREAWELVWVRFDSDADEKISLHELSSLLKAAGVGNSWTRGIWGREIMSVMDADRDGKLSWFEFMKAVGE